MKRFLFSLILLWVTCSGFSLNDTTKVRKEPVRDFFSGLMIIDHQSVISPYKHRMQLIIQHRFSKIESIADLFGIYGASNVRLALAYGVTDRIMLGFGTEKYHKLQDLFWKVAILQQTESGSMPIALSYFGNATIDARDKAIFGKGYRFIDRLSYFHQLILARKFCDHFSFELAGSYSHFNKVDSVFQNDGIGLMAGGRVHIYNDWSLLFEYSQNFWLDAPAHYQTKPQPVISFGFEKATSTHSFQVFASSTDKISPQRIMNESFQDLSLQRLMLGFNIMVKF